MSKKIDLNEEVKEAYNRGYMEGSEKYLQTIKELRQLARLINQHATSFKYSDDIKKVINELWAAHMISPPCFKKSEE